MKAIGFIFLKINAMRRPKRYCSRYVVCSHQHELVVDIERVSKRRYSSFWTTTEAIHSIKYITFILTNKTKLYWIQCTVHRTKHPFTLTHPINIHTLSSCTKAKWHTEKWQYIYICHFTIHFIQHPNTWNPKQPNIDSITTSWNDSKCQKWTSWEWERKSEE